MKPFTRVVNEVVGAPDLCMESHFEYGARAGYWRLINLLQRYQAPVTINASARALEIAPWLGQDALARGHENRLSQLSLGIARATWMKRMSAASFSKRSPPFTRRWGCARSDGTLALVQHSLTRAAFWSRKVDFYTIPTSLQ